MLGLPRCATQAEVEKTFRRLALREEDKSSPTFEALCESYWVLGDAEKRALFDHQGSIEAVYSQDGEEVRGGWTYSHSREKVFETFFRTRNPFDDPAWSPTPPPRKAEPVQEQLECTLEEMFNGCTKVLEMTRKRRVGDDFTDRTTELTICVRPGWKSGTKITFPSQGDEGPGILAPDIIFELVQVKHELFRRNGDDLEFTAHVTLSQALSGTTIGIRTLDGRTLSISCPEVVSPGYKKIVANEGMPIVATASSSKREERRGNLVIDFDIAFPNFIGEPQKVKLKKILDEEIN